MSLHSVKSKLRKAVEQDPGILSGRDKLDNEFGNNPDYLNDIFGITKNDLIRLERAGLAIKARYETPSGEHRTRWLILKEALDGEVQQGQGQA